jgi:hypothetical protein
MKKFLFMWAGLGLLIGLSTVWGRDIEADPNKEYWVTPEAGPWMVLAASFTGPKAEMLGREMVLEIRRSYGLPAWLYNRGGEERRKQQERFNEIRRLSPEAQLRGVRIPEQFAVLVGGYKDMKTARKELDDIKELERPPDKFCDLAYVEGTDGNQKSNVVQRAFISPFQSSFVVRNPTVPLEGPKETGPDPFLKTLNANEEYSLLRCRKSWTLVIKDFQGAAVVVPKDQVKKSFWEKLGFARDSVELLNASALQAHAFAEALRKMKEMPLEAYVLHTRHASFVTVGGFDSPEDPRIPEMKTKLGKLQAFQGPEGPIRIWVQPLPMEVPRF